MSIKPKCVIVTGRSGSGKTTLAPLLGKRLRMPVVARDDIKEGYINTFGVRHDELPPGTNGVVTDLFFDLVYQYLAGHVSTVIEAAFQHHVWEPRMVKIKELAAPLIVLCSVDVEVAGRRQLERGFEDGNREFYHGDNRVTHYKKTGEILTPAEYALPNFDVPTIQVSTDGEYNPPLDEIAAFIQAI